MAADWREFGDDTLNAPLRAALECFAAHGYHGTSIRMVADVAGLSVPGLYHHHRSKQELLNKVVGAAMDELLAHTRAAAEDSDGTPAGQGVRAPTGAGTARAMPLMPRFLVPALLAVAVTAGSTSPTSPTPAAPC